MNNTVKILLGSAINLIVTFGIAFGLKKLNTEILNDIQSLKDNADTNKFQLNNASSVAVALAKAVQAQQSVLAQHDNMLKSIAIILGATGETNAPSVGDKMMDLPNPKDAKPGSDKSN